jgi:hypothetical protein
MEDRHPLTIEQLRQILDDLAASIENAGQTAATVSAAYGDNDARTIRAQQVHAALLRFEAALRSPPPGA